MDEVWKPVVGHEDSYEVSNLGAVRSITKQTPFRGSFRARVGRVLRPAKINTTGHLNVKLSTGMRGAVVTRTIHSLVAEAFIGARPDGQQVRHLDGDPQNNRLSNLTYGTPKENANDMLRHGTRLFGSSVFGAKLSDQDILDLRDLYQIGVPAKQLSQEFAVSRTYVHDIVAGRRRSHVGGKNGSAV